MGTHSLWAQAPGTGAAVASDATPYTLGTEFQTSADAQLTGIWFYSAPGAEQLPTWAGIWRVSDRSLVAAENSTTDGTLTWSGPPGSGWIKATFDGSVTLTAGTRYKVTVFAPSGGNWYSATGVFWAADVTSGILTAFSDLNSTAGQSTFAQSVWEYPTQTFNSSNYWIDVEVTDAAGPAPTPVAVTRATSWAVASGLAKTIATTWQVRKAVTLSRSASWDTRQAVAASRSASWDVRAAVTVARGASWDALARVATSRDASWRVDGAVATTRSTEWGVASRVTVGRQAQWSTRATVRAFRQTSWSFDTSPMILRATTWHTYSDREVTRLRLHLQLGSDRHSMVLGGDRYHLEIT